MQDSPLWNFTPFLFVVIPASWRLKMFCNVLQVLLAWHVHSHWHLGNFRLFLWILNCCDCYSCINIGTFPLKGIGMWQVSATSDSCTATWVYQDKLVQQYCNACSLSLLAGALKQLQLRQIMAGLYSPWTLLVLGELLWTNVKFSECFFLCGLTLSAP